MTPSATRSFLSAAFAILAAFAGTADARAAGCASTTTDALAITAVLDTAEVICPCDAFPSNGTYGRCVRDLARAAVEDGTLPRACASVVHRAARQSTCGRDPGATTCCRSSGGTAPSCRIVRRTDACAASTGGTAVPGASESCWDACGDPAPTATATPAPTLTPVPTATAFLPLAFANRRGGNAPGLVRPSLYDYAPSIMYDGVYRMWWCGGIAGDHILYAEADSLDGPWHARGSSTPNSFNDVLQPTGNQSNFDGVHTCDPSVVRVNNKYFMYYGGYPRFTDGDTTRIGVAESDDGITWTRLNGGQPIIVPVRTIANAYGAGQPSAIFMDPYIYLIYTDTTGYAGNPYNGGGQYVLRSTDPTFQTNVEELGANGFAPYAPARHTQYSLVEAFSVDWQYIDALDAFAVAIDGAPGRVVVRLYDRDLRPLSHTPIELPAEWVEGPGIVSRPDKHALPSTTCGTIPFDVIRPVDPSGGGVFAWELARVGVDLLTGQRCEDIPLGRVFEGALLSAPNLPLMLVRGGTRLQFALLAPALRFSRNGYNVTSEIYHSIPYGAGMQAGARVVGAPGRPAAFELDGGTLWPVSCLEAITDNQSTITSMPLATYDSRPKGPGLFCIR